MSRREEARPNSLRQSACRMCWSTISIFRRGALMEINDEQWWPARRECPCGGSVYPQLPAGHDRAWLGPAIQIASDSAIVIPAEMIHYGVSKTALAGGVARVRQGGRGYRASP